VKILGKPQAIATILERADRFLGRFLVGFPNAHHLAHSAHLGAQFVLRAAELFKCPAGELDDHIVTRWGIFVECAVAPIGNLIQGKPACQLG